MKTPTGSSVTQITFDCLDRIILEPNQDINKGELLYSVDAAYGNDRTKRRSPTGFYFPFYRGAVVYIS